MDISFKEDEVNLTTGGKVYLQGILEQSMVANPGTCHFPTVDSDGNPVVIETKGKGLFCKTATSKVLSLSGLLNANF